MQDLSSDTFSNYYDFFKSILSLSFCLCFVQGFRKENKKFSLLFLTGQNERDLVFFLPILVFVSNFVFFCFPWLVTKLNRMFSIPFSFLFSQITWTKLSVKVVAYPKSLHNLHRTIRVFALSIHIGIISVQSKKLHIVIILWFSWPMHIILCDFFIHTPYWCKTT